MKKIFIALFSLLVLPFVVSAEEKVFGDIKYTIEEINLKEYVCEEIKDHDLEILPFSDKEFYVNDITDSKVYMVDITNPGICIDYNTIQTHPYMRFIIWGDNNEIYEKQYDQQFVAGIYYVPDLEYREVFTRAEEQYDASAPYYELVNEEAIKVTNPNETDFNNGNYLLLLEPNEATLLGEIDPSSLVAPKEKTGLTSDLTFEKDNLIGVLTFNNKKYYAFYNETVIQYAFIFDETGNYETFGKDKLLVENFSASRNGEYILLTSEQDEKIVLEVFDTAYNLIFSKEVDHHSIHFTGIKDNTNYIYVGDNNYKESKLISITKTKMELEIEKEPEIEKVPETYDGITNSIVIGFISLICLLATTLIYRRKKAN